MKRLIFASLVLACSSITVLAAFQDEGNPAIGEHEMIVKEMLAVLDLITETLKGVTDEPTAGAAKAGLQQAEARWQQVRGKAAQAKPPRKVDKERLEAYAEKFVVAQKQLFGQIGRVIAVPGGRELLKELRTVVAPADKNKKPQPPQPDKGEQR